MTIISLTPTGSDLMIITQVTTILFKPFMVGVIYYILHIIRFNNKVTIIENFY